MDGGASAGENVKTEHALNYALSVFVTHFLTLNQK